MYSLLLKYNVMLKTFVCRKLIVLAIMLVFGGAAGFAQTYKYYYGSIHSHTSYSDGSLDAETSGVSTPAQAYAYAKKSKHLDFLGISEHNHSKAKMKDKANYHKGIAQAKAANKDGTFVCLYGMEFGTVDEGHMLIYGVEDLINWEPDNADVLVDRNDYHSVLEYVNSVPGTFITLAHPKPENFNGIAKEYNETADAIICGAAMRNGPHSSTSENYDDPHTGDFYSYYTRMLSIGYKLGPTIDHDNHNTTFGRTSEGRTVILAKSLTKKNVIDAYRSMRFYASDDWNAEVTFTVDDKPMGSSLVVNGDVRMNVKVKDSDGEGVNSVRVMMGTRGSGKKATEFITEEVAEFSYDIGILPEEDIYFFLEIEQEDGQMIYTAPIWVKGSGA
jgi:hypothetical protein